MEPMRPTVSIIIKAFNEEQHIASAIESALGALDGTDGEVILADSASTDRTVAIAEKYPIKIVRLNDVADRSCGAGAQLGFQHSRGEFICLMDGDMQLHGRFLAAGIRYLKSNPLVAGLGGTTINHNADNLEYSQRARRYDPNQGRGFVTWLGGCGIYRRSAIDAVGYLTDRNLHGGEELELAARLEAQHFALVRIDCLAVEHYCRPGSAYRQLLRRIRSRNMFAPGELVGASIGRPQFGFLLRNDKTLLLCGLVALWWALIAAVALFGSGTHAAITAAALLTFPFAMMTWRWRSLRNGVYSIAVWNAQSLCFLPGLLRPRKAPEVPIPSTVVKDLPIAQSYARSALG